MEWLSAPVTFPVGVVYLVFALFGGLITTLCTIIWRLLARFFDQQTILTDAMKVNAKALEIADRTD